MTAPAPGRGVVQRCRQVGAGAAVVQQRHAGNGDGDVGGAEGHARCTLQGREAGWWFLETSEHHLGRLWNGGQDHVAIY